MRINVFNVWKLNLHSWLLLFVSVIFYKVDITTSSANRTSWGKYGSGSLWISVHNIFINQSITLFCMYFLFKDTLFNMYNWLINHWTHGQQNYTSWLRETYLKNSFSLRVTSQICVRHQSALQCYCWGCFKQCNHQKKHKNAKNIALDWKRTLYTMMEHPLFWPQLGMCATSNSNFLLFCASLCMTTEAPQILIWELQINLARRQIHTCRIHK